MPPKKHSQDPPEEGDSSEDDTELGPSTAEVLALMARMSATLQLVTERLVAGTGGIGNQRQREPELHPRLTVPVYTGFDDRKSVADFLEELDVYARASGASESYVLERILPLALQANARRWWVLQTPFPSLEAFRRSFRKEFLPPGYDSRVQRELERRTQHPEEGLVEYIRAMQELFNRAAKAAPESEKVAGIIRQSHPRYHVYLQGRRFDSVEDLARAARGVQEMILASVDYRPPPPATEALEPSCAWSPPARTALERTPSTHRPPERVGAYAYMPRALDTLECTRDGDGRFGAASPAGVSVSLNSRPREAPGAWDWSPQGPHLGGSPPRASRNPERGRLKFPDSESWLHDPRRDLQMAGRPQRQPRGGWQRGNDPAEPRGSRRRGSERGNVGTQRKNDSCYNCGQRGHFRSQRPQQRPREQPNQGNQPGPRR
ncbi:unnamed protein product [Ixodes hexagonus]